MVDRLKCIFRYVPMNQTELVGRFVKFLGMEGHAAEQICNSLFEFIENTGISIENCRTRKYDNARNMAGKYNGVQALVKERSPSFLAFYVPCFGHSLNLVGVEAVKNVIMAANYFNFVQKLNNF